MSQYKDMGLVRRFKKIQEDVLVKEAKKIEEAEEGVEPEEESVGLQEENEEEKEKAKEAQKTLRDMVKEMTPENVVHEHKLKEWEIPLVKRLVEKYKDDYKVTFYSLKRG